MQDGSQYLFDPPLGISHSLIQNCCRITPQVHVIKIKLIFRDTWKSLMAWPDWPDPRYLTTDLTYTTGTDYYSNWVCVCVCASVLFTATYPVNILEYCEWVQMKEKTVCIHWTNKANKKSMHFTNEKNCSFVPLLRWSVICNSVHWQQPSHACTQINSHRWGFGLWTVIFDNRWC